MDGGQGHRPNRSRFAARKFLIYLNRPTYRIEQRLKLCIVLCDCEGVGGRRTRSCPLWSQLRYES
jgi:hypothetical protein